MRHKTLTQLTALCLISFAVFSARADLFQISVTSFNSTFTNAAITAGSSSVVPLVQEVINMQGQFGKLTAPYSAMLRYANIPNAMNLTVNQTPTALVAQLTTPFKPGVINQTFTAPDAPTLASEIVAFLKGNNGSAVGQFFQAVNEDSPIGVLDGNPTAATARTATLAFNMYAFPPTLSASEESGESLSSSTLGISLTAEGGFVSSEGEREKTLDLDPTIPLAINDRVRLDITIPLQYVEIEGSKEYSAGVQLGLPVVVIKHAKDEPFNWQVTPLGGFIGAGSEDLASGGLIGYGGLTSALTYFCHGWQITMGNGAVFYSSMPISIGDYNFDTPVSQQIFKNGLKIGRELGEHWYVEAYGIDTEFAQNAFTPRYTTVGGGFGYRGLPGDGYVMLGAYTDFAPHYSSGQFQFGTGWRF